MANAPPQYLGALPENITMADTTLDKQAASNATPSNSARADCEECVGTGGWYRYDPSLESSPGRLYLSCMQCRGSGRTALARG